jgi:ATP-dependent DNA ligase
MIPVITASQSMFLTGLANSGLKVLIGKRSGSRYEARKRNGAWIKVKLHREQGFVMIGRHGVKC